MKNKIEYTDEMKQYFFDRTNRHIKSVKHFMQILINKYSTYESIIKIRMDSHDSSKFSEEELVGYIHLTWFYKCQKDEIDYKYPEGVKEIVDQSWEHHYKNNSHHPIFHKDVNDMSSVDIMEMVCDLSAMSEEYDDDLLKYVNSVTFEEYNFNIINKQFILHIVENLKK